MEQLKIQVNEVIFQLLFFFKLICKCIGTWEIVFAEPQSYRRAKKKRARGFENAKEFGRKA
jgi:hypothetical protein